MTNPHGVNPPAAARDVYGRALLARLVGVMVTTLLTEGDPGRVRPPGYDPARTGAAPLALRYRPRA